MPHEKRFIVTLYTNNKSNMGIELMEKILVSTLMALNNFRKSYFTFITEITNEERPKNAKRSSRSCS
jgi:hypothetical protein